MKFGMGRSVLSAIALTSMCSAANAIPTLQLGILNGVYDDDTDTVIAQTDLFTLYAFLTPGNGANVDLSALLADTYYISAALTPKTDEPGDFGSFTFGGVNVNVTADMTYGVPPLEGTLATDDPGDLADHGIFDTYFSEFSFQFEASDQANPLDVGSLAAAGLGGLVIPGSGMYYVSFLVDVSGLTSGAIHFDLYNSSVFACKNTNCVPGDIDVDDFAPFSHDAQSSGGTSTGGGTSNGGTSNGGNQVPEPASSLVLLGLGLLGLGFTRRMKRAA